LQTADDRLDAMIAIADATGYSLDEIIPVLGKCDQSTFDAVADSPSRLPLYMKSSVNP
jgi:hypothetical protein